VFLEVKVIGGRPPYDRRSQQEICMVGEGPEVVRSFSKVCARRWCTSTRSVFDLGLTSEIFILPLLGLLRFLYRRRWGHCSTIAISPFHKFLVKVLV
jgi:hypothetical protein